VIPFRCILVVTLALVLGCNITEPDCVDICSVWLQVEGTVVDELGQPVDQVEVQFRYMHNSSQSPPITCDWYFNEDIQPATTDPAGAFSAELQSLSLGPPDCVELIAVPPPGSLLIQTVDTILASWSLSQQTAPVLVVNLVLAD
jgi:hypothetical protein